MPRSGKRVISRSKLEVSHETTKRQTGRLPMPRRSQRLIDFKSAITNKIIADNPSLAQRELGGALHNPILSCLPAYSQSLFPRDTRS